MDISPVNRKIVAPRIAPAQTGPNRLLLSLALRGGVFVSAALVVIGLALFLVTGQSGYAGGNLNAATGSQQFTSFHDMANSGSPLYFPTDPGEIWLGSLALKPFALIMLGLVVLIATPVLNLCLAGWGFVRQKNWAFSLITLAVVSILALSFFLGKAGG